MNDTIVALARECVQHIADNQLEHLNYYPGRTTQGGLARVLNEVGSPVIPLPDEALAELDVLKPFTDEDRWLVEFPLWTREEGRSDWWLYLIILNENDRMVAYIDDIRYA